MTLSVVDEDFHPDQQPDPPRSVQLPHFEGEEVHQLRAKLTSANGLELGDDPHRLDQTIAMVVTGRVTRIDHIVDERTGQLARVEAFKVIEATEIPWDDASALLTDGDL